MRVAVLDRLNCISFLKTRVIKPSQAPDEMLHTEAPHLGEHYFDIFCYRRKDHAESNLANLFVKVIFHSYFVFSRK